MNAAIADIGALSGDKDILRLLDNTLLQTSVQLFVGGGGHGGLDIEGGVVRTNGGVTEGSAALDLGALDASTLGTIAMDGAGSTLSVVGAAVLGDAGNGSDAARHRVRASRSATASTKGHRLPAAARCR